MSWLCILVAAGFVAAAMSPKTAAHTRETASLPSSGAQDFDFLTGEWRVQHRRLTPDSSKWVDFEGTWSTRKVMNGSANMDEHVLDAPTGAYRAIALRSYDTKTGEWAIWWLDERYPAGPIGPPVKGRFENGVGHFYADYTQDGKPMRVRFVWSNITPTSARWEQASSADGGTTWVPNWIANLQRETATRTSNPADRADVHDFDFLVGEWKVRHRYLRVKETSREWVDVDGSVSHRALMGGRANMEEHTIDVPNGPNRALALRSYDPKTAQWAIWWLDGRDPSRMEEPMTGRFENGVGTFFGSTTLDGKPTRVRFTWSETTTASPRWQQAYSYDSGKTWETVWIMQFQRRTATASIDSAPPAERKPQPAHPSIDLTGAHGFDFLAGEWRVHHRRISARTGKWVEFDGTCSLRLMMEGSANIEEHLLNSPDGAYRAIGLRSYDAKAGKWSIWWLDGRYPQGPLDPPAQGTFEDGIGRFYSDYERNGKRMIGRLQWSDMTATSARWEQASSADEGKTWETNWIMELRRVGSEKAE